MRNTMKKTGALLLSLALVGCTTLGRVQGPQLSPVVDEVLASTQKLPAGSDIAAHVKTGVQNIRLGKYEKAGKAFSAGLRLNPTNGNLHFLNGLQYHLRSLSGDQKVLELAEAGYALALRFDPSNHWAAYLLGHVYFQQKRFLDAQNQFAYGLLYAPKQPDLLRAMAVASYYSKKNIDVGHWAAEKAVAVDPQNPANWRAAAFTRAAVGDSEGAQKSLDKYQTLVDADTSTKGGTTLKKWSAQNTAKRVAQWREFHSRNVLLAQFSTTAQPEGTPLNLGDAGADDYEGTAAEDLSTKIQVPPAVPTEVPTPMPTTPPSSESKVKRNAPIMPKPMVDPSQQASKKGMAAQVTADRVDLKLPKMTLVDVAILRTEEVLSQSKGVNILSGLKATLTGTLYAWNRVTGFTAGGATARAETRTIAPTLALSGLQYNLNIFNEGNNKAEVLARPSLLAVENKPSKFYSGAILHVQLNSNNSDGSLVDVPIGIHLGVTPTFLDDQTVKITVHAERNFIETRDEKLGFTAFSQTAKTSVDATAVLRFGQTLILSGLQESENTNTRDGVPVLQHIPGLQYLFSRKVKEQTKKSILILISPHKARFADDIKTAEEAKRAAIQGEQETANIAALKKKEHIYSRYNIPGVMKTLEHSKFYREFRAGDLRLDEWHNSDSLFSALKRALGFLWY
jgi:cytochrome c-type biogenesis protein CcmH/NrfG